jgi:hypothetical protein
MKTKLFSKLFNLLFIETTFNPQTFSTTSCTINKLLTFQRVLQKSMNILIFDTKIDQDLKNREKRA